MGCLARSCMNSKCSTRSLRVSRLFSARPWAHSDSTKAAWSPSAASRNCWVRVRIRARARARARVGEEPNPYPNPNPNPNPSRNPNLLRHEARVGRVDVLAVTKVDQPDGAGGVVVVKVAQVGVRIPR